MSKELIERLRGLATMSAYSDYKEAADRIEELEREVERKMSAADFILKERDALQADNARLRSALNTQINDCINFNGGQLTICIMEASAAALAATPEQSLAEYRNKAADRIEELEAINEKLTDWVEKRKEDLTAAYRTIDYLRAELERQKKAREGLTPAEALADYFKRNSKAMEERVERNNAVLKRLREDTE